LVEPLTKMKSLGKSEIPKSPKGKRRGDPTFFAKMTPMFPSASKGNTAVQHRLRKVKKKGNWGAWSCLNGKGSKSVRAEGRRGLESLGGPRGVTTVPEARGKKKNSVGGQTEGKHVGVKGEREKAASSRQSKGWG